MKKYALYVILILFFSCCSDENLNTDKKIHLDFSEKLDSIPIDSILVSMELVPLELTEKSAIGSPRKFLHVDSFYFFLDSKPISLIQFSESGNFIRRIGKRGNGPYEFRLLTDFVLNPFTQNIDLLDPTGKIISYNYRQNQFVDEKNLDFSNSDLRAVHSMMNLSHNIVLLHSKSDRYQLHWYDLYKEQLIKSDFKRKYDFGINSLVSLKRYNNKVYFINIFDYSLYEINEKNFILVKELDLDDLDYRSNSRIEQFTFEKRSETNYDEANMVFKENKTVFPFLNFFLGMHSISFYRNNKVVTLKIDEHGENHKLVRFLDSQANEINTAMYESEKFVYGWIMNASDYKSYFPKTFLTRNNLEILHGWTPGDNPILIKYFIDVKNSIQAE
ncbi:6-bladed beta-propeller [Membranihabitans maritimus]|uniref:6-bladed beta-propeller n=1 Tax=Membranihabitans maritimus TaxID=2904244 RepID=UPI001F2E6E41|nr:6-bladed beta-propeller [Membranihabitans maritimus]